MKQLTLIRHAKANKPEPKQRDFFRTLAERGRSDAPRMGRHLDEHYRFSPQRIYSSPATRALRTAQIIAEKVGYPELMLMKEPRIYEAPVRHLVEVLKECEPEWDHVCLVGHNPGLENLTNWLVGRRAVEEFKTCGVAMLELNIADWARLKDGCAKLTEFLYPAKLWGWEAELE
jgi:phosphohistidine phosphatase